jgi:tRNA (cytosine49-C5)-methyltransferase
MKKKFPEFKERFIERYSELTNFEKFKEYSMRNKRKSIRINTLKIGIEKFSKEFPELKLKQVPWCEEGFFVSSDRTDLGNLFGHSMGYFYVQEASSMLPVEVLNPKKDEFILDIAAAPGSKTTQMSAKMKNSGIIVANDNNYNRLKALTMNLQRSGVKNTIISLMEGRYFSGFEFDKILLDAPCTGTGTLRKSPYTILEWSPGHVRRVCGVQRQLIKTAFNNLKSGGTMVYSTCTLEPEENEGIVSYLLDEFDNAKVENIKVDIKSSKAVLESEGKEFDKRVSKCLRIWPQDNDTDGFFVAKIKKT